MCMYSRKESEIQKVLSMSLGWPLNDKCSQHGHRTCLDSYLMACRCCVCSMRGERGMDGSCPFDYHTTPGTPSVATMGGRDCGSDGL